MIKYSIILAISFFHFVSGRAQETLTESDHPMTKVLTGVVKAINKQKTANSKDILTSFFKAGLDNILGDEHAFSLNSSFLGIDSIFRGEKSKKLTYEDQRKLRKNSFNFSLTGDSSNNIQKISGGFTFTLVNKKDVVYTKFAEEDEKKLKRNNLLISNLIAGIRTVITQNYPEFINDVKILKSIGDSWNIAAKTDDYSNLDPYIIEALGDEDLVIVMLKIPGNTFTEKEIRDVSTSILLGKNPASETFKEIGEKYARKPLLTFTPLATYDREHSQGEFSFASEFTVGLGKNYARKPWEIEVKTQFKLANDTTVKKVNYENKPLVFSIGLNKVLMETSDNEPKMEFKFFTQYDHQLGKVSAGAKAGLFTLNGTFRVNVFNAMWLPITLKYDPENNNFLGLFSITANLGD